MGPPLKPFLNLSRKQQKRRIHALLQNDSLLCLTNNISSSNPTRSSCVSPTVCAPNDVFNDVCHEIGHFCNNIEQNNVEDLNAVVNERSTALIDKNVELEVQGQSSFSSSLSSFNVEVNQTQSTVTGPTDLRAFLAHWAIKHKVPQSVTNDLLRGLQKFGHPELPSDSRILCNTPNKINIQVLAGGTYAHYGLERALTEQLPYVLLQCTSDVRISVTLQINVNIDGLPISKSSKSQLWPILGQIIGTQNQYLEPFLIGAFHGNSKPSSVVQFLEAFITEYTKLNSEGFMYNNRRYFVKLNAVLADTPARNFITCFPAHNSRCGKCIQSGETIKGRRIFEETDSSLRTHASFREGLPTQFQNIISPFETINVDIVKQFPLDYMHLLCLGTMKKLILIWIRVMGKSVAASTQLAAFNDFYSSFSKFVPVEFARHPRSLEEVAYWKATEFRLFLLYLGPAVLQYFLEKSYIVHFNVLNCAVRILCDPKECISNNRYAQDLMIYFVNNVQLLYDKETVIYNIHNLIHISSDVLNHGPLDSFSCFPFESFLQKIKFMIKGGAQPLAQIMKRITERSIHFIPLDKSSKTNYILKKRKNRLDYQLPEAYTDPHGEIQFRDFLITDKSPNNCCYLSDKSVVVIEHICYRDECPVIIGRKFINSQSIDDYPCDSRSLGIFKGQELSELETWNIHQINRKGFVVPYKTDCVYIFPLIHSDT